MPKVCSSHVPLDSVTWTIFHAALPSNILDMRSIFISAKHPKWKSRSRHQRASPLWSSQRRRGRQGTSWYPCSSPWSTAGWGPRTGTQPQWSCPARTTRQYNKSISRESNYNFILKALQWCFNDRELTTAAKFTWTISSSFWLLLFSTVTPGCILT